MITVADYHPHVLICVKQITGKGAGTVRLSLRDRCEDEVEDLEALPVEEQAAMLCSVFASDEANAVGWWDWEDEDDDCGATLAADLAWSIGNVSLDCETFAEAKCRIRTGGPRVR